MTIRVRDDDVLLPSSSTDDPFGKFSKVHRWICEVPDHVMHVPTILVTEIQQFPQAIEYIRTETAEGRMEPQLHGLEHIDYGKLDYQEVCNHLNICRDWMINNLGVNPTRFMTPWGASQPHLHAAAAACDYELVDCSRIHKLAGRNGVVDRLRSGESPDYLENDEIFLHWWESGLRLKRVLETIKHGSWAEAERVNEGGIF